MSILNKDVFNEYNLNYDPVGLKSISLPDSFMTPAFAPELDDIEAIIEARKNREALNRQGLLSLDDAGIDMAPTIDEFSNKAKPGLNIDFAKQLGSTALGLLTGNPIVGLLARGIGALGDRFKLPGRVGGVDLRGDTGFDTFRRSTSLADFLQRRRDKRAREEAARIGADKQRMNAFRAFRDSQPSGGDGGGGNIQGSISRGGTDDTPGTPFYLWQR